ncbi:MAG: AI-2E family transporter [Candidatus Falkowbacteria bacterium]|nr:AI-2E family transporter [Candidatus Falkowbacteria bacterium]
MSEEKSSMRITLTTGTLIKIIVVLFCLYFAYLIQDILAILFVSIVLSSSMDPWVDWMQKKGIPRSLGISFIYVILLSILGLTVYLIIPPMVNQFNQLLADFPSYVERFNGFISSFKSYTASHGWLDQIESSVGNAATNFQGAAGGVFSTIYNIVGGFFSLVIILVITFYMVVEENMIRKLVWSLTPEDKQDHVMELFKRIELKMGLWFRGQLILCLVIFALTYIGLLILGVKYALILALIAGFTEFIPYLGPLLGAVPAVFLAFSQSPTLAIFVAVLYIIVQQVENNFLVPKVMEKAIGMNPIVSIVVLMIGFSVGGFMGALLSIPVATAALVIFDDIIHKKNTKGKEPV